MLFLDLCLLSFNATTSCLAIFGNGSQEYAFFSKACSEVFLRWLIGILIASTVLKITPLTPATIFEVDYSLACLLLFSVL